MLIYRVILFSMLVFSLTACDFLKSNDAELLNKAQCDANLPCTFPSGVKIWLNSSSLSPETPFTIFSQLPSGLIITNAKLEGVSMYMGYIPLQFKKHDTIWQSDTMVGICSEKNMLWQLIVTITDQATGVSDTLNYYFYVTY